MYDLPVIIQNRMAQAPTMSVVDVYDIAASIGKEFEVIIDNYGPEAVTEIMPKVINVLEQLEILSNRNQQENAEIADLRFTIERLQGEKTAKAEERARFEQELEEIEDSWRTETKDLVETVGRLEEENRRLRSVVREQNSRTAQQEKDEEEEVNMMKKLKEVVDKQRQELRAVKRENQQKSVDLEAMQCQLERLVKLNADYRRKSTVSQRQAKHLIQEKADLQAQLHDKEQQILRIKERLNSESLEGASPTSPVSPISDIDMARRYEDQLTLEGKMVIDMADPNRPRFTLNELRDVLTERNELKAKLIEVEEDLQQYRPETNRTGNGALREELDDEDLPVQGPINKEPDEKLYPERYADESGIRKLFKFLFGPSSSKSGRRSSTPKLASTKKKASVGKRKEAAETPTLNSN